nr:damage-inducible protein CinA [uncultured Streptococcus sp.]
MEFFGNKPFTQEPERAISQADQLLDYRSCLEEDRKIFSQLRMREEQALLVQDYALEQAEEKGLERGLERGRAEGLERGKVEGSLSMLLNLVRQHLLTAEVASQQLGMSVAEFESLL